jgi:hypothetical protein
MRALGWTTLFLKTPRCLEGCRAARIQLRSVATLTHGSPGALTRPFASGTNSTANLNDTRLSVFEPVGQNCLARRGRFPDRIVFIGQKYFPKISLTPIRNDAPRLVLHAQQQIAEFFSGERHIFTLPIGLRGTSFQRQVWKALSAIPYGSVVSYSDVAKNVGLSAD